MSVQRAIRRRRARKNGIDWPSRPQPTRDYGWEGDGYATLTPTKGWRCFCGARLRAMVRLAEMRATINRRMGR
jgi:hypothetical protein